VRRVDAAILILVLMLASPALAGDRFFDSGGVRIRYVLDGWGRGNNGGSLPGGVQERRAIRMMKQSRARQCTAKPYPVNTSFLTRIGGYTHFFL